MKRTLGEWKNIFEIMNENAIEVEVVWLDSTDEYVLCSECELFEDGFTTEEEAENRLIEMMQQVKPIFEQEIERLQNIVAMVTR